MAEPQLHFRKDIPTTGFETKKTSDMTGAPTPIVRELIQNVLDAAQDAKRQAEVLFSVEHCPVSSIPGIEQYREALKAAIELQEEKGTGTQWRKVAEDMQKAVKKDVLPILFVLDNGVGLNPERMTSLLSEGLSNKGPSNAGSYGVGHIEAFAASMMRYVLYAGLHENPDTGMKDRIASGHALIASWIDSDEVPRSAEGYYITKLPMQKDSLFEFPQGWSVPRFFTDKIEFIEKEYGTGSVVAISAFNRFLLDAKSDPGEEIIKAAARHFFVAIHREDLKVTVRQDGKEELVLDQNNLRDTLEKEKQNKRATKNSYLSGERAWNAYQTLVAPEQDISHETEYGAIRFLVRQTPKEPKTRIHMCRNGMWITGENKERWLNFLVEYRPMSVLVLAGKEKNKAWELIRGAEGPLHIGPLDPKRYLPCGAQEDYEELLEEIKTGVIAYAEKLEQTDRYLPDDFMLLDPGDEPGGADPAQQGRPEPTPELPPEPTPIPVPPKPGPNPSVPPKPRGGRHVEVKAIVIRDPMALSVLKLKLEVVETGTLGLRIILENGTDPTCDRPLFSGFLGFRKAFLNGKDVTPKKGEQEILLPEVTSGVPQDLEIKFEKDLPETSVFRIDVVNRNRAAQKSTEYQEVSHAD